MLFRSPKVTISVTHDRPSTNDNVYLTFLTLDPLLTNGLYTVKGVTTSNSFWILHPSANSANDAANTVNVRITKVNVTATKHELSVGDQAYLVFTSGDNANTENGYHTVVGVQDSNTFNIILPNIVMSSCNANVHLRRSDVVIIGHAEIGRAHV